MFEWLRLRRHGKESDLSAYLDEELSAARRRKVEEHLRRCSLCRAHLAELRALKQTLGSLPEAAAPRSFALTPEQARSPRPRPAYAAGLLYPALRYAAAIAAVFFFAFVAADVFVSTTGQEGTTERGTATLQGRPQDLEAERSLSGTGEEGAADERKVAVPAAPAPGLGATPGAVPRAAQPPEGGEATPPDFALAEPRQTAPEQEEREATAKQADASEAAEAGAGPRWLRPLEGALGGAALALLAAAFLLRRRRTA